VDTESGLATPAAGSVALDTSSVGTKVATAPTAVDNVGHSAGAACVYSVVFDFRGFFRPVDNPPTVNVATAGSAIPVKFRLGGNRGLAILASGYPQVQQETCPTGPTSTVDETVTASSSGLSYSAGTDRYVYVWKTNKQWAGTCRKFVLKLVDGSTHTADFKFR
jgi:hypothetical protein